MLEKKQKKHLKIHPAVVFGRIAVIEQQLAGLKK